MTRLLYFVEDGAQEAFIRALVLKAAALTGCHTAAWQHDVRIGRGRGRTFTSFAGFLADVANGSVGRPDLLVVSVDADCDGAVATRRRLSQIAQKHNYAGPMLIAVPDPHIERWYMADQIALQAVAGCPGAPALPPIRCRKDLFKQRLVQAFQQGGIAPALGGAEFAEDIVDQMDPHRAGANDSSLDDFFHEARSLFSALCADP